jgi:type I restriction enzyme S subunit
MSQLKKLIAQLCPNGIEYVALDALFTPRKGENLTNDQAVSGPYPVVTASRGSTFTHSDFNFSGEYITISSHGAYAGYVSYYNQKFWLGNNVYLFESKGEKVSTRFYFHVLKSIAQALLATVNTGGIPYINSKDLSRLRVPYPPIQIQKQIVEILDTFSELEVELELELAARQSQYDYYRKHLLSFPGIETAKIKWTPMAEIAYNRDSRRKPVTKEHRSSGIYPYYGASGIVDYVDNYLFDGDYLLVSEDGANLLARSTPIAFSISGKNWVNNHAHILEFETYELQRLTEIYLNSIDLSPYVAGGAQPKLSQSNMNKILVPVPPAGVLAETVAILDAFETLMSDNIIGLPAEINTRRKQYEYYRNKLLTFSELEVS